MAANNPTLVRGLGLTAATSVNIANMIGTGIFLMPRAGGEYVFIREAYGPRWGFLFGWTQFFIARTGSQAALAVGFAIFLNILTGGKLGGTYFTLHALGYDFPFGH